jgi:hypothetical protein
MEFLHLRESAYSESQPDESRASELHVSNTVSINDAHSTCRKSQMTTMLE